MDDFDKQAQFQLEVMRMNAIKEFIILQVTNDRVSLNAKQMTEQFDQLVGEKK